MIHQARIRSSNERESCVKNNMMSGFSIRMVSVSTSFPVFMDVSQPKKSIICSPMLVIFEDLPSTPSQYTFLSVSTSFSAEYTLYVLNQRLCLILVSEQCSDHLDSGKCLGDGRRYGENRTYAACIHRYLVD